MDHAKISHLEQMTRLIRHKSEESPSPTTIMTTGRSSSSKKQQVLDRLRSRMTPSPTIIDNRQSKLVSSDSYKDAIIQAEKNDEEGEGDVISASSSKEMPSTSVVMQKEGGSPRFAAKLRLDFAIVDEEEVVALECPSPTMQRVERSLLSRLKEEGSACGGGGGDPAIVVDVESPGARRPKLAGAASYMDMLASDDGTPPPPPPASEAFLLSSRMSPVPAATVVGMGGDAEKVKSMLTQLKKKRGSPAAAAGGYSYPPDGGIGGYNYPRPAAAAAAAAAGNTTPRSPPRASPTRSNSNSDADVDAPLRGPVVTSTPQREAPSSRQKNNNRAGSGSGMRPLSVSGSGGSQSPGSARNRRSQLIDISQVLDEISEIHGEEAAVPLEESCGVLSDLQDRLESRMIGRNL
jgi:hypothetical protein